MNSRIVVVVLAAALALGLALWLRNPVKPESASEATDRRAAEAQLASTPAVDSPAERASRPAGSVTAALHGLRLLAREEAEARGWSAPVKIRTAAEILGEATGKKWKETEISINFTDAPLEDVLTDIRVRYGLSAKVDEDEVDVESTLVTFKVDELRGDQAIDLILKMADLAWYIDASGILWVTSKERARALEEEHAPAISKAMKFTASMARGSGKDRSDEPRMAVRMAEWMKDRKVSVSIANKPLKEAVEELAGAGDLNLYSWSEGALAAVEKAPIASVIGEDLPLGATIEGLLAPAGLGLNFWGHGSAEVVTREEVASWEDFEKRAEAGAKEQAKERASFAARKVRIEGKILTLQAVASQLEAQLGARVIVMPEIEGCLSVWEADGLEQTAGEVLDILGRDAPLDWGWLAEFDPDDPKEGPKMIWLVNR